MWFVNHGKWQDKWEGNDGDLMTPDEFFEIKITAAAVSFLKEVSAAILDKWSWEGDQVRGLISLQRDVFRGDPEKLFSEVRYNRSISMFVEIVNTYEAWAILSEYRDKKTYLPFFYAWDTAFAGEDIPGIYGLPFAESLERYRNEYLFNVAALRARLRPDIAAQYSQHLEMLGEEPLEQALSEISALIGGSLLPGEIQKIRDRSLLPAKGSDAATEMLGKKMLQAISAPNFLTDVIKLLAMPENFYLYLEVLRPVVVDI